MNASHASSLDAIQMLNNFCENKRKEEKDSKRHAESPKFQSRTHVHLRRVT